MCCELNFTFRDWRVVHALSHHIYPNSLLDVDISMFAPLFQFLPDPSKTLWGRYGPWIYSPLVYSVMFHGHMLIRWCVLNSTELVTQSPRLTSTCISLFVHGFDHRYWRDIKGQDFVTYGMKFTTPEINTSFYFFRHVIAQTVNRRLPSAVNI
jgi:hypothetical protein